MPNPPEAEADRIHDSRALFERLAPGPQDAVRLLALGSRTAWLERVREEDAELPIQGAPSLVVDIRCFPLTDLFDWLEDGERNGFLHFSHAEQSKNLYLERGEIVFAESNQQVDRLGESLLRAGMIQLDQLLETQRAFQPGDRFGKLLVERGYLTPRELWNGVKYQVEEIVRSLFAHEEGRAFFWDQSVEPDNVVRLSLPTKRLAGEGLQRRAELEKFLGVLEDPRVCLASASDVSAEMGPIERGLMAATSDPTPFTTVRETLGLDREAAGRSVQLLRLLGAMKLLRLKEEEREVLSADHIEANVEDPLRERIEGFTKLIAALAAPIAAVEGEGGIAERLAGTLSDVASRFPELMGGVELTPGPGIDPDAVIDRALSLSGDGEAQVNAALGELVAYLEFEIMNHPGIDDPHDVLEGVASLRSVLGV